MTEIEDTEPPLDPDSLFLRRVRCVGRYFNRALLSGSIGATGLVGIGLGRVYSDAFFLRNRKGVKHP